MSTIATVNFNINKYMNNIKETNSSNKLNYLNKYSDDVYNKLLSEEEKLMIFKYTAWDYLEINNRLRKHLKLEKYSTNIKMIDSGLNKFKFDQKVTLYRRMVFDNWTDNFISKTKENGYIIDEGFMSTTIDRNYLYWLCDVALVIEDVDPNFGAYIKNLSKYKKENEFLLKRNTILQVEDIIKADEEKHYIIKAKIKK